MNNIKDIWIKSMHESDEADVMVMDNIKVYELWKRESVQNCAICGHPTRTRELDGWLVCSSEDCLSKTVTLGVLEAVYGSKTG